MSLVLNSCDINYEIFKYLNFEELLNLYKTNKILLRDIEKFVFIFYKKTFKQLYIENKCLHCNLLCDNVNFRICDYCALDTCWNCFKKVGNLKLYSFFNWDDKINSWYPTYKCNKVCIYKCYKCKRDFNKNKVIIKNSLIICITCYNFKKLK